MRAVRLIAQRFYAGAQSLDKMFLSTGRYQQAAIGPKHKERKAPDVDGFVPRAPEALLVAGKVVDVLGHGHHGPSQVSVSQL